MRSAGVTLIILLASAAQARETQLLVNCTSWLRSSEHDKLADRALEVSSLQSVDLQETVLGKGKSVQQNSSMQLVKGRRPEPKPGPHMAALPQPEDLTDLVMLSIMRMEISDEEVNMLAWKYLGYHYDEASGTWDASRVFPKWAEKYPQPPDFLGITRNYTQEIDEPVMRAKEALYRTVPMEHKDNLRAFLKPLGWKGLRLEDLTPEIGPNLRRRAHVANWLIYYREALHGVSLEELKQREDQRAAAKRKASPNATAPNNQSTIQPTSQPTNP